MNAKAKPKSPRRSFTIAEARNNLSRLVHRSEELGPIGLTRRGQPVAVILSQAEYERLQAQGPGPSYMDRMRRFRDKHRDEIEADNPPEVFEQGRDRSPGRDVKLFK